MPDPPDPDGTAGGFSLVAEPPPLPVLVNPDTADAPVAAPAPPPPVPSASDSDDDSEGDPEGDPEGDGSEEPN